VNAIKYDQGIELYTQMYIQETFNVVLVEVLVGPIKMCTDSRIMEIQGT
jgi:hypothetical protein